MLNTSTNNINKTPLCALPKRFVVGSEPNFVQPFGYRKENNASIGALFSCRKFNGDAYSLLQSNFLYKIHSNVFSFKHVVLGGIGKL